MRDHARLIVGNVPRDKADVKARLAQNYIGEVSKQGRWARNPGSWLVQRFWQLHPDTKQPEPDKVGCYRIVHNLNNINYSVSLHLHGEPGNIKIENMSENSFDVETTLSGVPALLEFGFTLALISLEA